MRLLRIAIPSLALIPTAVAAAAVSPTSGTFKGKTSERQGVVIHVVRGVVKPPSRLSWSAPCGHLALTGVTRFSGLLHRDGSFHPRPAHTITKSNGSLVRDTTTVRFTVQRQVVTGIFVSVARVYSASGVQTERCVTPKITFTARR